jgi:hypothetical protein
MPVTMASTMLVCRSMPPVRSIAAMHEHYGNFFSASVTFKVHTK